MFNVATAMLWVYSVQKCKRDKITQILLGYRALGLELIPVYRQSARRWLFKTSPAVGCHYFLPGLRSPSQPKYVTVLWPVPSYTAWWQRQLCLIGNLTHDLLIASPTPYRYATAPPQMQIHHIPGIWCRINFLSLHLPCGKFNVAEKDSWVYWPEVLVRVAHGDDETDLPIASSDDAVRTGRTDPDFQSEQHLRTTSVEQRRSVICN